MGKQLPVSDTRVQGSAGAPDTRGPLEIASGVFCLGPWGHTQTNVYVVRAGASWILVDAGWAGDATRILGACRLLLGPESAPKAILLTHVHPDHAGSARALADAWHCPVLVAPGEIPIANADLAAMKRDAGPLDRWVVLPAVRAIGERRRAEVLSKQSLAGLVSELSPNGVIPDVDEWMWVATPGHTRGHASFMRARDRVLLTGDALVTLRVNSPLGILFGAPGLSGPPWYTTWDAAAARRSINAIAEIEPSVPGSGHGQPLTGPDTAAAVHNLARRVVAAH